MSPISQKVAQILDTIVFTLKVMLFKMPKQFPNIWATFIKKMVVKNFQKSLNLVTLAAAEDDEENTAKCFNV